MEQIKTTAQEAVSTLTNMQQNEKQVSRKDTPSWFPIQFQSNYNNTDLVYDPFCLRLFAQLEAVKREKFSPETMRQWFIEFIRRGWNKNMVQVRYDALMGAKIYGIEKLEIADWVNAVQVYAMDEVNLMIEQRIDTIIARGRFLKDKKIELTEAEKRAVNLAAAKEIELGYNSGWYEARETYQQERKKRILGK